MENSIEKARLEGFKEAILTVSGKNAVLMTRSEHNSDMAGLVVTGILFCAMAAFVVYSERKSNGELVKAAYENGVKDGLKQITPEEY